MADKIKTLSNKVNKFSAKLKDLSKKLDKTMQYILALGLRNIAG
jgi:peptidoglycan hydrolase CwlO-like protein